MWLNTTEKNPATFQRQVQQVCETYQQAPKRQAKDGTRTVCIDEMTGIQALERASPDRPVRCGSVAKQEFEYIRHGTTTLIGNFDVVSGEMFCETLGPYLLPHFPLSFLQFLGRVKWVMAEVQGGGSKTCGVCSSRGCFYNREPV